MSLRGSTSLGSRGAAFEGLMVGKVEADGSPFWCRCRDETP